MKIGTSFLCAISCILVLKVYARKHKVEEVYDFQQFDDLTFDNATANFLQANYTIPYSDYAILNGRYCYIDNAFKPYHEDVSQARLIFPTEILKDVWNNDKKLIGFAVNCDMDMLNSNWYKFYQSGKELDQTKKYTSFAIDVGYCEIPWGANNDHDRHRILTMEIQFKNNGEDSDYISMGEKELRSETYEDVPPEEDCSRINNLKNLYIPSIPTGPLS